MNKRTITIVITVKDCMKDREAGLMYRMKTT